MQSALTPPQAPNPPINPSTDQAYRAARPIESPSPNMTAPAFKNSTTAQPDKPRSDAVHCLVILATKDKELSGEVSAGGAKVIDMFQNTPALKDQVSAGSFRVMRGDEATTANIVKALEDITSRPNDSIFVFYAGRGATDPTSGHVLLPEGFQDSSGHVVQGSALARSRIGTILAPKPHRFICIVTDACSAPLQVGSVVGDLPALAEDSSIVPIMLENKGILDVNASTPPENAFGTRDGGLCTQHFVALGHLRRSEIDDDHDGKTSWKKEFFPKLQARVDESFQKLKSDPALARTGLASQEHQTVTRYDYDQPKP